MSLNTPKIIILGIIAVGSVMVSLTIAHRTQIKLRENDGMLRQQGSQLAELAIEHQRLSNLVAQVPSQLTSNQTAELEHLRNEAETLRRQTNELGKQAAERRFRQPLTKPALSNTYRPDGPPYVVSDLSSKEYDRQLAESAPRPWTDAQNLAEAVSTYAREHEGEFPSSFHLASDYYFKSYRAPESSAFEMVYHGSLNDLSNIPLQAVALIRERQAWPTPAGKWARIYAMANGFVKIVESDDNFQSWEVEHVIPAPATKQRSQTSAQ